MEYQEYEDLRIKLGLTNSDVARLAGINPATLSAWKRGEYTPKSDKIRKIQQVLKDYDLAENNETPNFLLVENTFSDLTNQTKRLTEYMQQVLNLAKKEENTVLLEKYTKLSSDNKKVVQTLIDSLLKSQGESD